MMASTKSRDLEAETVEMGTRVAVAAVEAMDIADVVDSGVTDVAVAEEVTRAGELVDVAPTSPKVLRS
jgi:ATP phosphoribosyltransferase